MKILVTGAKGMLGAAVKEVFSKYKLILTDRIELDVRNIKQVKGYLAQGHISDIALILHLAAETDTFACETNPADAYFTNAIGTQNMVWLAKCFNIPIVYIGTAGIFDGLKQGAYTEEDEPWPINHYGRSKWYGELAAQGYKKHYIIRSGWMMGGGPGLDKKFVNKIYNQIKSGNKKVWAITDIFGTPTYTYDIARTIKNIVEAKAPYGIYHSSGDGIASRYDVAKAFVEFLGLDNDIQVMPVSRNEFCELFPVLASNVRSEVLSIDKIKKLGYSAMRPWKEALKEYAQWYKNGLAKIESITNSMEHPAEH